MHRRLPRTPAEWLKEIRLAIADADKTKPFGILTGTPITDADLFHLAPLVCLKFRGRKTRGAEAKRVTETALANYVVNSDPEGIDHGLKSRPMLAFALCYVATHLALDLLNEQEAETILDYPELLRRTFQRTLNMLQLVDRKADFRRCAADFWVVERAKELLP